MRYLISRFKKDTEERIYRIYMSDSLYYMAQNKYCATKYSDLIKPKKVDNRSAEEIAQDVVKRLELDVVKE